MKKIFAGVLMLIMVTGMFSGCSLHPLNIKNSLAAVHTKDPDFDENKKRYMEFVMNIASENARRSGEDNVLISPASMLFALEMTAAGANGNTLDEMTQTLLPGATPEQAQAFALNYLDYFDSSNFNLADSIWIDESMDGDIKEKYVKYISDYYGAEATRLELVGSEGRINDWVSDKTYGRIEGLIAQGSFNDKTAAVLVNAIAFDGEWKKGIDENSVHRSSFHGTDHNRELVDFIHFDEDIWIENDLVTGFVKPYAGENYAFMALLPKNSGKNGNDILMELTAEDYMKLWENREEAEVGCRMPEFKASYNTDLNADLQALGMKDAFTDAADFTGISDNTDFWIGRVVHQTMIKVDRNGTEAAAATGISMHNGVGEEPGLEKQVLCDRPFAYAIIDMETGLPIFLGSLNHM